MSGGTWSCEGNRLWHWTAEAAKKTACGKVPTALPFTAHFGGMVCAECQVRANHDAVEAAAAARMRMTL